jgi:hypothetical protein
MHCSSAAVITAALLVACLTGVTKSSDTPPEDLKLEGKRQSITLFSNFFWEN